MLARLRCVRRAASLLHTCKHQSAKAAASSTGSWGAKLFEQLEPFNPQAGRLRFKSTMAEFADELETVNDKFVEARDEIELATEDAETVYFNEGHEASKKAVAECLGLFNQIREQLDEAEKGKLTRSMGMKMKQLEEELAQLDNLHA